MRSGRVMGKKKVTFVTADGAEGNPPRRMPTEMSLSGDMFVNLCKFEEDRNVYMEASGFLHVKDPDRKIPRSILMHRLRLLRAVQEHHETIDEYMARLRNLAKLCEYGPADEKLLRNVFVFGLKNKNWIEKLFDGNEFSLEDALRWCRIWELNERERREQTRAGGMRNKARAEGKKKKVTFAENNIKREFDVRKRRFDCYKCGRSHGINQCPAFGKICYRCNRPNHFANQCKFKWEVTGIQSGGKFRAEWYVQSGGRFHAEWDVQLTIDNNGFCKLKLFAGPDNKMIPHPLSRRFDRIDEIKINKCDLKLRSLGNGRVNITGYVEFVCILNK